MRSVAVRVPPPEDGVRPTHVRPNYYPGHCLRCERPLKRGEGELHGPWPAVRLYCPKHGAVATQEGS